jgi:hypothetical protein
METRKNSVKCKFFPQGQVRFGQARSWQTRIMRAARNRWAIPLPKVPMEICTYLHTLGNFKLRAPELQNNK